MCRTRSRSKLRVRARTRSHFVSKKAKETKATDELNVYVEKDLCLRPYTRDEVHNKIDNILQKAKRFYVRYKKEDAGKEADDDDLGVDVDAAVLAWQNFSVFCKDHPFPSLVSDAVWIAARMRFHHHWYGTAPCGQR